MKDELKVHSRDVIETIMSIKTPVYKVGDVIYRRDKVIKQSLSTHTDCEKCGKEFKKPYTYELRCDDCSAARKREVYASKDAVEWDGESAVYSDEYDEYFYGVDDIEIFMEENDIESIDDLLLLQCEESTFNTINIYEIQEDEVHEDWEPSTELENLVNQLNEYLTGRKTGTWFPTNKRVIISL